MRLTASCDLATYPPAAPSDSAARQAADHLPVIARARTPLNVWNAMRSLCREVGSVDLCFVDMIGGGGRPEPVAATFTPDADLDDLRRQMIRSDAPLFVDDRLVALPAFGPQGLEAALIVARQGLRAAGADLSRNLGVAFQLAYSRYRQLLPRERSAPISLSDREREIMIWVVQGKSNAVIAEILGISASTVDTYMRRVFRKLDVADRTSAAMRAMAIGALS